MELLITFVVAWVCKSVWDDKVDDFHDSASDVAKRVNSSHPGWSKDRRHAAVRNAKRRHAAGWLAYQFRHGWIPALGDIRDGYRAARIGHAEWIAHRPESGDGWWKRCKGAFKAGWSGAGNFRSRARRARAEWRAARSAAKKPKPASGAAPTPTPAASSPGTPWPGKPAQPRSTSTVQPNQGVPMTAGETGGYAGAQQLTDGYGASLTAASEQLEQYEADLIAGGMGNDPAAMATLAQMREGLETAKAATGGHQAALNSHEQGAEYARDKGDAAAATGWLGQGG